jgi:hypothetical protein
MKTSIKGSQLNLNSDSISICESESEARPENKTDTELLEFRIGALSKKHGNAFYGPTFLTLVVVRAESDLGPGSSGASGSDL